MELILNVNQYGYSTFLDSNVDIFMIGIQDFSMGYLMKYSLDEIPSIAKYIHEKEKKLYLSFNAPLNQNSLNELEKLMLTISDLHVDGFVINDFGAFELFKEYNLTNKIIFNPTTLITNKYSAKYYNEFDIDHVCIANEINYKDILEIAKFTNGNIELLAQGYFQICNSKRPLITNFLKQFRNKQASETDYYYIKEESRDYAYPIHEVDNDLLIYIDKQRCLLPYLKELINSNIKYLRIDTVFLDINDINTIIEVYRSAIDDTSSIEKGLEILKNNTNSNFTCLDNISVLKKEKENE